MDEDRRVFFDQHPDPMWVYDLATLRFRDVNDAAVARYGYTRDEFLAMTIAEIRPEEDRPALMQTVPDAAEGLRNAGLWRHRLKSGEIIEVTIRSHGIGFDGRPARLVVARDVSEVVAAERRANALLQLAGAAAQLGGWRYDAATDAVEWSQDAIRLLRIPTGTPPSIRQVGAGLTPQSGARFAPHVLPDEAHQVDDDGLVVPALSAGDSGSPVMASLPHPLRPRPWNHQFHAVPVTAAGHLGVGANSLVSDV